MYDNGVSVSDTSAHYHLFGGGDNVRDWERCITSDGIPELSGGARWEIQFAYSSYLGINIDIWNLGHLSKP